MRTEFRPGTSWYPWHPAETVLRDLIDLLVASWGDEDHGVSIQMDLERPERSDTAENTDEVRELITPNALQTAVSLSFRASRKEQGVSALFLSWHDRVAWLTVIGSDQFAAEAFRDRAAEILRRGAIERADDGRNLPLPATEECNLSLSPVRFAGTYTDVHQLLLDVARQTQEADGEKPLARVHVALTEVDRTITVNDLTHLDQITGRDVRRLQRLNASFSTQDGPSSWFYVSRRALEGTVSGSDDAAVRALRSATNDLLRERGRSPHWLRGWMLYTVAFLLYLTALGLLNVDLQLWPVSVAVVGAALLAVSHPFYLPQVELLSDGEPTRWSRWSKQILGLAVAWLIGCLAIPFIPG